MSSSWFEAYLGLIFQVYGLAFFVLGVALMPAAPAAAAGLEPGARYLFGAAGVALADIGLLTQAGATTRAPDTVAIIRWLQHCGPRHAWLCRPVPGQEYRA